MLSLSSELEQDSRDVANALFNERMYNIYYKWF